MNKEETRERIKVMQAYVEGKQIQCRTNYNSEWRDSEDPNWHRYLQYRVKPENEIIPYANAEEFLKAMKVHGPFIEIKYKNREWDQGTYMYCVTEVTGISITLKTLDPISYEDLLNHNNYDFRWQDKTPLGIKI